MGWDAVSHFEKDANKAKAEFRKQSAALSKTTGVDGYLELGGLDISHSGRMLEKAVGKSVYADYWAYEDYKQANWDFKVPADELIYYSSAKAFWEVCVKYKALIEFSY